MHTSSREPKKLKLIGLVNYIQRTEVEPLEALCAVQDKSPL